MFASRVTIINLIVLFLGYLQASDVSLFAPNFVNYISRDNHYGHSLRRIRTTCAPLWYNRCVHHFECCSLNCAREPQWQFGVCKPNQVITIEDPVESSEEVIACKPLWFNKCVNHHDCCTRNCERKNPDWKYGVCGPSAEMLGRRGECKPKGFQFCKLNGDCCSRYCNRKPEHLYGTCEAGNDEEEIIIPTERPTHRPVTKPTPRTTQKPIARPVTKVTTTTTTPTPDIESVINPAGCGTSDVPSFDLRIVGGRNATKDEFPWQVSIRTEDSDSEDSHVCGGAIISKDYVLSAAHCVSDYKPEDIIVVVGCYMLDTPTRGESRHDVEKIIVHESYRKRVYDNDIALIKLSNPISFDRHKKAICLPDKEDELPRLLAVSGWGSTEERGRQSNILQTVNVRTIGVSRCRQLLREAKITDNMICAGEEGKDSCQGDSGGPMFSKSEEGSKLFGLVSFGIGCGRKDRTGVYTKVSNYLHWIRTNMH